MTTINGDNLTVPGQVTIALPPSAPTHAVVNQDLRLQGKGSVLVTGVNLNASAPSDLSPLVVLNASGNPVAKYIPTRIVIFNASGNASGASLGIWSAAGGTGTNIVTAGGLTNLTASTKFIVLTINALTDYFTAPNLYPRLTVAAGVACTADLLVFFDDISTL